MAKRKRLSPAGAIAPAPSDRPAPETKSMFPGPAGTPPIAQVAGAAAAEAALQEVTDELHAARAEGRMVQALPLERVDVGHLVRDRIPAEDDEFPALLDSLRIRGQQTPIEVVDLGQGQYGLISGWRRLTALRQLQATEGEGRGFDTVLALLRRPDTAAEAYQAMVEENEIRVGLSFYERARIVARATEEGVYLDPNVALSSLFASASRARRSKIGSFMRIYDQLDRALRFPAAIPERLGLALSKALEADAGLAERLAERLRKTPPTSAAEEISALEKALRGAGGTGAKSAATDSKPESKPTRPGRRKELSPGLFLEPRGDTLVLSGPGVTQGLRSELETWLARRR